MLHLPIGTIQSASVLRKIETGYVLIKETNEVLLHNNETENELENGQEVDVFLYQDKDNQVVATTKLPTIQMGVYDWAKVVEVIPDLGAFVHIGIAKDILISVDDLPLFETAWPQIDDMIYVTLGKDQEERLLALPATEGIFEEIRIDAPETLFNKPIDGHVYRTNKEGAAFISAEVYRGYIHHTELEVMTRFVVFINGSFIAVKVDGTINVSLKPLKQDRIADDADAILTALNKNDGILPLTIKSDPEDIRKTFNFSKSAFKRALGRLLKERQIEQRDGNTYLITKE